MQQFTMQWCCRHSQDCILIQENGVYTSVVALQLIFCTRCWIQQLEHRCRTCALKMVGKNMIPAAAFNGYQNIHSAYFLSECAVLDTGGDLPFVTRTPVSMWLGPQTELSTMVWNLTVPKMLQNTRPSSTWTMYTLRWQLFLTGIHLISWTLCIFQFLGHWPFFRHCWKSASLHLFWMYCMWKF